jgi:hypothetical protein
MGGLGMKHICCSVKIHGLSEEAQDTGRKPVIETTPGQSLNALLTGADLKQLGPIEEGSFSTQSIPGGICQSRWQGCPREVGWVCQRAATSDVSMLLANSLSRGILSRWNQEEEGLEDWRFGQSLPGLVLPPQARGFKGGSGRDLWEELLAARQGVGELTAHGLKNNVLGMEASKDASDCSGTSKTSTLC